MVFALLTSCSDFLDVQSKGQLTDDEMFTALLVMRMLCLVSTVS